MKLGYSLTAILILQLALFGCIWEEEPSIAEGSGNLDISHMSYDEVVAMGVPARCAYTYAGTEGRFYQRGFTDFYLNPIAGEALIASNGSMYEKNPAFGIEGNETSGCEWLKVPENGSTESLISGFVSAFSDIRCEAVNYSIQHFMPPVWEALCEVGGGNVTVMEDRKLEGSEEFEDAGYGEITEAGPLVCEVESLPSTLPAIFMDSRNTARIFTDGEGRFRIESNLAVPMGDTCTRAVVLVLDQGDTFVGCAEGEQFSEAKYPEAELTECKWTVMGKTGNDEFDYVRPGNFRCVEWLPDPGMFELPEGERACTELEIYELGNEIYS